MKPHDGTFGAISTGTNRGQLSFAQNGIFSSGPGKKAMEHMDSSLDRGFVHHMVRLALNKTPLKETEHWIPTGLSAQQFHPDSVTTLGRPWIWTSMQGGFRTGPTSWPSYGIGQFVFGWSGRSVLLLCRGSSMLELGTSVLSIAERMDRMTPAELEEIVQSGAVLHATLTASTVVWVPYGWFPMVMACPGVGSTVRASGAFLPYYNEDLCFAASSVMSHVVEGLGSVEFKLDNDSATSERFKKDVGPVLHWLRVVLEREVESDRSEEGEGAARAAGSGRPGRKRDRPAAEGDLLKRMRLAAEDRAKPQSATSAPPGGGARPGAGHHAQADSSEARKLD